MRPPKSAGITICSNEHRILSDTKILFIYLPTHPPLLRSSVSLNIYLLQFYIITLKSFDLPLIVLLLFLLYNFWDFSTYKAPSSCIFFKLLSRVLLFKSMLGTRMTGRTECYFLFLWWTHAKNMGRTLIATTTYCSTHISSPNRWCEDWDFAPDVQLHIFIFSIVFDCSVIQRHSMYIVWQNANTHTQPISCFWRRFSALSCVLFDVLSLSHTVAGRSSIKPHS